MRKLTITRQKTFVACLGKMKVYIEDPTSTDLVIQGVSCRKLGTLKNGETVTFEIGDDAAKVYVIADRLSVKMCNEYYPLPAGSEDIVLTGRNHFSPTSGNAYRFDNQTDHDALANRQKGKNVGVTVLIVSAVVGFVLGVAIGLM